MSSKYNFDANGNIIESAKSEKTDSKTASEKYVVSGTISSPDGKLLFTAVDVPITAQSNSKAANAWAYYVTHAGLVAKVTRCRLASAPAPEAPAAKSPRVRKPRVVKAKLATPPAVETTDAPIDGASN
jgi:hypothetical protein